MADKKPHIAYLVSAYPTVSHTFVLREVLQLRKLGFTIDTFSVRRTQHNLSSADRAEQKTTTALLPVNRPRLARAHLKALGTHPRAYWETLRFALSRGKGSARRRIWQVFYFGEAVLFWTHLQERHIKHVHAHFANVGSDVARLASHFAKVAKDPISWSFTMHGPAEFLDIKGTGLSAKASDADFVVCISDYCRSQLMWLTDASHWSKFSVVHCGVEVPSRLPTRALSQSKTMRIITVGRLVPVKGHDLLLDAVLTLKHQGWSIEVRVIGDGPARQDLERRSEQLGLADQVSWLGSVGQDDISAHYDWADVFCLPSMMEGVPVVLMEAMSRSLPVVTTQITGVPELVENGVSGLLVAPGRSDLLADALVRLGSDSALAQRLAENAYEKVRADFNLESTTEELAAVFSSRLNQ